MRCKKLAQVKIRSSTVLSLQTTGTLVVACASPTSALQGGWKHAPHTRRPRRAESSIDVHNYHSPVDLLVTLADLCRDRPCKQPKGQALFFLVDDGYPEMLSALGAEEVRDIREGTMLEAFVGV